MSLCRLKKGPPAPPDGAGLRATIQSAQPCRKLVAAAWVGKTVQSPNIFPGTSNFHNISEGSSGCLLKRKLVIFNPVTFVGRWISVRGCAGHLRREGSGLMGEASRHIKREHRQARGARAEATVNPGLGGNEKAWILRSNWGWP